ncbi:hypothetical protein ABS751_09510 [Bacillus subtilis]
MIKKIDSSSDTEMLITLFATSKTTNGDRIETRKFGKKTAKLLPIHISIGFS